MIDNDLLVGQNPTEESELEFNLYLITVVQLYHCSHYSSNVTDFTYLHIILSTIYTYLIPHYTNHILQEDPVY